MHVREALQNGCEIKIGSLFWETIAFAGVDNRPQLSTLVEFG